MGEVVAGAFGAQAVVRGDSPPSALQPFLDHSKPNTARWCSMAICGNRMKARRHYQRNRG